MIFHIATAVDWAQAQHDGAYTTSTVGVTLEQEGFIHSSQASQVERVANAYYAGRSDLVLLIIDPSRLTAELRYEDVPGEPLPFPHIYGPLNVDAVVETRAFAPDADGRFSFVDS